MGRRWEPGHRHRDKSGGVGRTRGRGGGERDAGSRAEDAVRTGPVRTVSRAAAAG